MPRKKPINNVEDEEELKPCRHYLPCAYRRNKRCTILRSVPLAHCRFAKEKEDSTPYEILYAPKKKQQKINTMWFRQWPYASEKEDD